MKVVIPVGDLHIGGGCKVLVELSSALQDRGHDVEIVIPQSGTVKYDISCKLTTIPHLSPEFIPYGDVILPNFYTTFISAFAAYPNQCIRFSLGFEPYWVPDRDLALWTYQQGVPIITISHWMDQHIFRHVNQRSTVVHLGVDPSVYNPAATPNSNQPKVILYIARDPKAGYALKGFDDFQESLRILQKEWNQEFVVHLICPDYPLALPGIPHKAFSPQTDQDMISLYRSADLFVSSSWFEAFSIPPLEAMACGTPVVTTDSGGVMDYCIHLKNAYVSPPRDPRTLASGMASVLSNPSLANELIHNGLHTAARFTKRRFERNMVDAIEAIYRERLV